MEGQYIKINRKILEWEWYKNINTKVLFIHMLLKANWKDSKFEGKAIQRGSFVSSIKKLSDETDLTEREIRTAILHLKTTGEVTSKNYSKYSVFTVNNYNLYQASDKQNDRQETGERHSNDILTPTIEEDKERKEGNNTPPISPVAKFEDFWTAYPKHAGEENCKRAYVSAVLSNVPENDLVEAAVNYADYCRRLHTAERFIKEPANFIRDNKFVDFLNGKYKPPQEKKQGNKYDFKQNSYDFAELENEILSN